MSKFKNYWLKMPIGSKMRVFILVLLLVVSFAAGFNMYTTQFAVGDVNELLKEIDRCENVQEAISSEETAFLVFVRNPSEESKAARSRSALRIPMKL